MTLRDAFDWTDCTQQLRLSSTGTLAIDYDALNAQVDNEQTDNLVDSEATGDASVEGADEQLPEELPATIYFSFTLDPANPGGSSVVGGAFQEGQAARPGAPDAGDATNAALPAVAVLLGMLFVAGAALVKRRIRA